MDRTDGAVIVEMEVDSKPAQKELDRVEKKVEQVSKTVNKLSEKKELTFSTNYSDIDKQLEDLGRKHRKLEEQFSQLSPGDTSPEAMEIYKALDEYEAEYQRLSKLWATGIARTISRRANKETTQAAPTAAETPEVSAAAEKAAEKMERITQKIESLKATGKEGLNALKIGFKGLGEILLDVGKKAAKASVNILKGLGSATINNLKRIAGLAGKAAKGFLSLFTASKKTNSAFSGGVMTMLKYSLGIRSLYALGKKLRSALVDGFKNLAQFSDKTNASLSLLKSGLTQVKNSLATAFEPILTAVAPILSQFISMVSTAADRVAQLTAALMGQTSYSKAVKVQENYAASLEGTAGAAKDASKSLAGFDEINKLSNSSKTGGGTVDPKDMFETEKVDPFSFKSWGEAFSAMLSDILENGIPKLKAGLNRFTDWLNEFTTKLYEMFTFPGVYEKVSEIGNQIAAALNGAVLGIDWSMLGAALGAGLGLALGFLVSFIYSFDWQTLGASLAAVFNHLVYEVDWYQFGMLLWAKFKIALETLAGFLLNLDMTALAQAASNIVVGFFNSMTETIQNIDWFGLGEQIKTFLVNIDWDGMAISVFTAIGAAFGAAAEFLWGLIHEAWQSVVNWWHEVAYQDGQFTFEGLLKGISDVVANIGTWIKEHIFDPFMEGFKSVFGIASPSTVMAEMGSYLIEGLFSGMTGIAERIRSWGASTIENLKSVLGIASPSTETAEMGDYMMQGMANGITDSQYMVLDVFQAVLDNMQLSFQTWQTNFTTGFTKFRTSFTKQWSSFWRSISYQFTLKWNEILDSLQEGINNAVYSLNALIREANRVSLLTGRSYQYITPITVQKIPVPKLASGAVIPPNREFLAVLGDQKQGTNIETPLSTMVQAFRMALSEGSGQNEAVMEVDGEKFGKLIYRLNKSENSRVGVDLTEA